MTLAERMAQSDANATAEGVAAGLDDALATIADIWRRLDDGETRNRAKRAMEAVIGARMTMEAADAFVLETGRGRPKRSAAFDALCQRCSRRLQRKP